MPGLWLGCSDIAADLFWSSFSSTITAHHVVGHTVRQVHSRLADSACLRPARLALLINVILISAIIIITPHRIALFFERVATQLRTLGKGGSGGMVILFLCVGALRSAIAASIQ
jgi:hypothetical protein